jgi:hypothetical protein
MTIAPMDGWRRTSEYPEASRTSGFHIPGGADEAADEELGLHEQVHVLLVELLHDVGHPGVLARDEPERPDGRADRGEPVADRARDEVERDLPLGGAELDGT